MTREAQPSLDSEAMRPPNLIVALIEGAAQGMKMAVGIAALLIVFLGLEALVDLGLAQLPSFAGVPLSVTRVLAWLAWPFTVLLGLSPRFLAAVADSHDVCAVRIRSCGEHGHFCRRDHGAGASSAEGCLAPGTARALDVVFDDVVDRLCCGSLVIILARIA